MTPQERKIAVAAARKCEECGKIATRWWHNPFHPNGDWPRYVCDKHGLNPIHEPFPYKAGIALVRLLKKDKKKGDSDGE